MSQKPDPLAAVATLPGVFESVEAARGSVDALLRDLRSAALRRRVTEVTAESVRLAAWASAALEGRSGSAEDFVAPIADPVGANALRLAVELASLAETWESAPLQSMARMHVLAAGGLVADEDLGRPATAEAAARLDALARLLAQPTAAPAVVVAAVVHGEVLATNAFGLGTGLVARAASRCVLVARGLDPRAASVPEAGHLELGAEAYGLALAGYRSGGSDGVGGWVSHCAEAVALGGRVGRRVADGVRTGD
ncbi:MAG TPA: oxidoreductase [Candidatus Limnocylindria bacterium]|nr:oxidoreductase [Candidatus Limnocylindria bacterium]